MTSQNLKKIIFLPRLMKLCILVPYKFLIKNLNFGVNRCISGHVICDVMGQNQSHVAKHKMAAICIFSKNVKICPFFVFIKNKIFV